MEALTRPAHGGYPGDVLVSRRDLFDLTLHGEKVGGLEVQVLGGHWSGEAADLVVEVDRDPNESTACRVCGARAGEPCSPNCPARIER